MTIWDCFSVYNFDKSMDDDKGTTRVLCHPDKGKELVQEIGAFVFCKEVFPDKLVVGVKEMTESVKMNPKRKQFMEETLSLPGKELMEKYYPVTTRVRVKTMIRKALLVTGIYGVMKKCLNQVRGR